MRRKQLITVAIDSPAAAGAGTQAKLIAKRYKLLGALRTKKGVRTIQVTLPDSVVLLPE